MSFFTLPVSVGCLSLHHLKSFQVVGMEIRRSVWLGVFGELKKLKTIHIIDYANKFLNVLSRGIPRDPAVVHATVTSAPGKLEFKALKSLSLSSTLGEYYGEPPWAETLALCFRERRKRGLTLRRLCIEGHDGGSW